MTSAWVQHCKNYASENGCSYKEAMTKAKATYKPSIEGGKLPSMKKIKKTANRVVKHAKKGSKMLDKADKFIELVDEDVARQVRNTHNKVKKGVNHVADIAEEEGLLGGKFNLKRASKKVVKGARKAKQISKVVAKDLDKFAPMVAMVNPELGAAMEASSQGIKAANRATGGKLGSTANGRKNPYLNGGSFQVPHGGSFKVPESRGGCHMCSGSGVPTNSHMVSPFHPSFTPNKPKTFSEKIHSN